MIRVWSDGERAGALDRLGAYGSTFAYDPDASAARAVSLTMPIRLQSWDTAVGLTPIFEMNLPEGALRERLRQRFAKATGTFDDLDLLGVVGRTQIGRLRYTGMSDELSDVVPFQSIDAILRARRDGELFEHLLSEFATHSGISGVQPKVMLRGSDDLPPGRASPSARSATHIVKLWEARDYPELAANEFFCLQAARRLGLSVPDFQLSDDGGALVVERFDRGANGWLGFEDFCVLNGLQTRDKYKGGYEGRLWKRLREFVGAEGFAAAALPLFKLFVLNCAIRNGDAHLKNFGLLYDAVDATPHLAPAYDLVTTAAYLPKDAMALTLEGSTTWPDYKRITRLGQVRADLSPAAVREVIDAVLDAVADTRPFVERYFADRNAELGARMLGAWDAGCAHIRTS